jgi:AcrR family transcriptional regulator
MTESGRELHGRPSVTEPSDRRADATRLQIVLAASHEFARKSYSQVSLDDILAQAAVTKGAMYFHFRSKHELALAIIERQGMVGREALAEVTARKLSALETLVDLSCAIVNRDLGDEVSRAGLNLLESIGRADGVQARLLNEWVGIVADVMRRAAVEGDIVADRDPEDVARVLVSAFMGSRQTTDVDDAHRYFTDLQNIWILTLPGFANPERLSYLDKFIRRRTAVAMTKATTLDPG